MKETFFTSDIHFGHKNILRYNPDTRPYESVEDMTEKIIEDWNKTVRCSDTIYILGDVSFFKAEESAKVLRRAQGKKILIRGNHDNKNMLNKDFRECFIE